MPDDRTITDLAAEIHACRLCADRFAATATAHAPRPVVWFAPKARLLIAGQAPGARVHASGQPFTDPSGDRLRDWTGVGLPAAAPAAGAGFAVTRDHHVAEFAGCLVETRKQLAADDDAAGADLPPPPICARAWRGPVLAALPHIRMVLAVGGAAQAWHLGPGTVTDRVADWRRHAARGIWPLPHPSWRNTAWLKRNPWFETDLLPELRHANGPPLGPLRMNPVDPAAEL